MGRKKNKPIELEDNTNDLPDSWFGSLSPGPKIVVLFSMIVMVVGLTLQAFAFLSTPADGQVAANAGQTNAASADEGGISMGDAGVSGFIESSEPKSGDEPSDSDGDDVAAADESDDSANEGVIDPELLREWSPVIFTLGFSFFVGFAIGAAVRSFLKLAIILIGGMLLLLFGLQYGGVIQVDWAAMEVHYDRIVAWLESETTDFRVFIQGALPSSAMGATGLVLGFRKR